MSSSPLNFLLKDLSIEHINALPIISEDFQFKFKGWYFFICPISGIIKIQIVRKDDTEYLTNLSVKRFLGFKAFYVIGLEHHDDFSKLYNIAQDYFINIQSEAVRIFSKNKIMIKDEGVYDLDLVALTYNHVNNDGDKMYYVFNGIDSTVFDLYYNHVSTTEIDQYLNDPFYVFNYGLDGFIVYKHFLDRLDVPTLKVNRKYKCKVGYITRNLSLQETQLAITEIYTCNTWVKIKLPYFKFKK